MKASFGRTPLALTFGLVSAALARVVMQLAGTRLVDPNATWIGVILAAAVGIAVGAALHALHDRDGWSKKAWLLVPFAGAAVGMAMQEILLLDMPEYRVYAISDGITSNDPYLWVLVGAPFGAVPALLAGLLLKLALRAGWRTPIEDARERAILPLATGCALLHAFSLSDAEGGGEAAVVVLVLALSLAALLEVLVADRRRVAFVQRLFAGEERSLTIEACAEAPSPHLPLLVGGIEAEMLVIADAGASTYRAAARTPVGAAALTFEATIAPLLRRRRMLFGALAATGLTSTIALAMRVAA